jgi:type I restriction enzyme R subunit
MQSYQFTQKEPLADDVLPVLKEPVGILQRKSVITRVIERLKGFIETFDENMGDL